MQFGQNQLDVASGTYDIHCAPAADTGNHTVSVRVKDTADDWSAVASQTFVKF
jgi:hypothetical protein